VIDYVFIIALIISAVNIKTLKISAKSKDFALDLSAEK
jgi:hypothetical protein